MQQDVNSNSTGSLLKEIDVETDSDVPEFSLPPKSIVKRPRKTIRKRSRSKWRKHCRKCFRYCSGVLLVLVVCACVLSIALLFWFSLRLHRDVENLSRRLTIEINRVQAEQLSNVEKCTSLETKMKQNMQVLNDGQNDIKDFKKQLKISYAKISLLNGTLLKMFRMLHGANSKMSMRHTVNALKKGMADTGAEMTKLSDEIKQIEKETSSQSKSIRGIVVAMYNISSEIANITGRTMRTFHDSEGYLQQKFHDENVSNKDNSQDSSQRKTDVYDVIHKLNSSLFAQVKDLRTETEAFKMKTGFTDTYNEDSVNISNQVTRVRRDMSAIHVLLSKLNMQVGNLTHSMNLDNIYENSREIRLLWRELDLQNQTIVQIQQLINADTKFKSGISSRSGAETEAGQDSAAQDSAAENNFEIFPRGTNQVPSSNEQKRDTFRTRFKNVESGSDRKLSDRFGELMEDNIT